MYIIKVIQSVEFLVRTKTFLLLGLWTPPFPWFCKRFPAVWLSSEREHFDLVLERFLQQAKTT